ncbi:MAG: SpoIIE family protein phosphatase [Desulfuromusa sp.]|jgi:sigma-B regulation protein RsbU (phosphoserine phosphatase)|nr:SpoIIE family protein phosphatase [Desulfuromusa sp.]
MKFRTRLLILLLTITLLPLSLSFLFQRGSMLHFGNKLASDTHVLLNSSATTLLHTLVDDFGRILKRDKAMGLLALQIQAQAVECRLSSAAPEYPQPIFFSTDYASPQNRPEDLIETEKRQRLTKGGKLIPIPVSYSQQVIFLAQGRKPLEVAEELKQMSSMPDVYKTLHNIQPDLFLWQYTALESGIHSSYPGKGGYPDSYDPRQRQWYKDAVAKGEPIQQILTDLTTGTLILTLARPIYAADGKLAGVTALDIDYRQFFADWSIPAEWVDDAKSMVLIYHEDAPDPMQQLEVLLRNRSEDYSLDWRMPVEHEYLDMTDPQLQEIQHDLINGTSAVRKITYQGEESLWAYGSRIADEPFPLVIVPYQQIITQAVIAEKYVNQQISLSLKISAALTVFVVAAAILLAIIRSRKVTQPVMQLATAANQLSEGNFDAKVEIHTGDELENLGHIFNGLGSRLKEREQMKQSLALAKEIQQQLLPDSAPICPNFDLAALSLYCDETGGDYFDYIELKSSGQQKFGLAVGDVSGHGIGTALVMATARGVLHSLVDRHGSNLETLTSELNDYLCRGTADAYFMTMFYGVLNPEDRSLAWISAGHAPFFFYQTDGQVKELYSSGIPLGIIKGTPYEMGPITKFIPGEILLIGTDGIWEARNMDGEMFGTERVHELLIRHAEASADSIAKQLITALDSFRGDQSRDDDITLMVVKAC